MSMCGVGTAFAGTYFATGNIWDAMYAAGGLALVFVAVLLVRATRPPVTIKQRIIVLGISLLLLTGVTGHWVVMNSMTRWQYTQLQEIRKRIEYGLMVSRMYDRATPVFAAYHRQSSSGKRPLPELFFSQNSMLDDETHLLLVDSLSDGLKLFASVHGDSGVILTTVSGITQGPEPRFRNYDGRAGFLQSRLYMTPKGMDYEIQN
jgi:hypothetical protein